MLNTSSNIVSLKVLVSKIHVAPIGVSTSWKCPGLMSMSSSFIVEVIDSLTDSPRTAG